MRYKDMKLSDISNRAKSPDLEIIEARKLIKELVGRVMRIKSHSDTLENLVQDIAEHDPYTGGNDALEDYSNWIEEARMLIGKDENS